MYKLLLPLQTEEIMADIQSNLEESMGGVDSGEFNFSSSWDLADVVKV